MKNQQLTLLLLTVVLAVQVHAQKEDWLTIQKIPPGTLVFVRTTQQTALCTIQKVTDRQLFLRSSSPDSHHPKPAVDLIVPCIKNFPRRFAYNFHLPAHTVLISPKKA